VSKTIAIIGAGPGVGLAVAERFGREGFKVALISRNRETLLQLETRLSVAGIEASSFPADVLDRTALSAAIEAVAKRFGKVDVLEYSPTLSMETMRKPRDIDVENEQFHLDFQVLGPIAAVRAVLPGMLKRKRGSILFTTASSAQHPATVTGSFGVAAGGLLNYARLLKKDLAVDGVHVGLVAIAGLVVPIGQSSAGNASDFPPGIPLVKAEDVAEQHWQLHLGQKEADVFVGDIEAILANRALS
jgi:short-subunit dehydrogenase